MHDPGARAGKADDDIRQLPDREFAGIAEIERAGDVIRRRHQAQEGVDEIVDVAEGSGLLAAAVNGDVLATKRLDDEIRDDPAVIRPHAGPVGIEDAGDLDPDAMLAMVVEEERFRASLALVVAGARPDRIDVPPIVFRLRMLERVAIDLRRRGLENGGVLPAGQVQEVEGAEHAGLGRMNAVRLIVGRRGGTGQVVDPVDLEMAGVDDVVRHDAKRPVVAQMGYVGLLAGMEVVQADHLVAEPRQSLAQVRAKKPGPAGDQNRLSIVRHGIDLSICPMAGRVRSCPETSIECRRMDQALQIEEIFTRGKSRSDARTSTWFTHDKHADSRYTSEISNETTGDKSIFKRELFFGSDML